MVTEEDVRSICLSLPGVSAEQPLAVSNKGKLRGLAWVWLKRIDPKKGRIPWPEVYAIRTPSLDAKEALIATEPEKYFTEPHYNGYPAVLVRLAQVEIEDMEEILIESWLAQAPKELVKQYTPEQLLNRVRSRNEVES